MKRLLVLLCVALLALLAVAPARAVRHDLYPLEPGAAGPRVCGLQWLLGGHRPSVYRTPRFRVFGGKPNCIFGARTKHALKVVKYRLGYPLASVKRARADRFLVAILEGHARRPAGFAGRAAERRLLVQIPAGVPAGYPLSAKAKLCGVPGAGTHSYTEPPNNWQSDRALDLCVDEGTAVRAVGAGTVCSTCGYGPFANAGGGRFAGLRLELDVAGGDRYYYAHLRSLAAGRGAHVARGQLLGFSGVANGVAHLHIACQSCDPYSIIGGVST